ncbi:MAG: hypothetical protein IH616_19550 [Gemmatimonadales bacterium]|nr:hypothetical protein [Gemmatimonadales bacterium]
MCSSSRQRSAAASIVAAIVLLAAIPGTRLHAQGTPESTAEYRQLVDRLAERAQALARTESLTVRGAERGRLDTLTVGRLTLVFPPQRRSFVETVARTAWDSVAATFGSDTAALQEHVITLGGPGVRIPEWAGEPADGPRADLEFALGVVLGTVRDTETRRFYGAQWFRDAMRLMFLAEPRLQDEAVYTELATKPWRVVRACYDGDLAECHSALAVSSDAATAALRYTPEERRRIVAREREVRKSLGSAAGTAQCVEARVDSACVDVMRRFHLSEQPLSSLARATLIRTAFTLGGDGSYARLLASDEPEFLARLAAVAGVAPDALLAEWRRRILAARPKSMTLTRISGWIAFLWAAAFAVAATRSSRWRRD